MNDMNESLRQKSIYSSILNIISKVQNFTCDIFHVSYEGSLRKSILLYQQCI